MINESVGDVFIVISLNAFLYFIYTVLNTETLLSGVYLYWKGDKINPAGLSCSFPILLRKIPSIPGSHNTGFSQPVFLINNTLALAGGYLRYIKDLFAQLSLLRSIHA